MNWKSSPFLFQTEHGSVFPTFRLLDSTNDVPNHIFRFRPSRPGEDVTIPPLPSDEMAVDEKSWMTGSWLIEYVGDGDKQRRGAAGDGIPVRRTWLSRQAGDEDSGGSWDALVKIEQLVVRRSPQLEEMMSEANMAVGSANLVVSSRTCFCLYLYIELCRSTHIIQRRAVQLDSKMVHSSTRS